MSNKVLLDVISERERQRTLPCEVNGSAEVIEEFDKGNSQNDWVAYITSYAGRASAKVAKNEAEGQRFRTNMVKVAALALAAIEAFDKGYCDPDAAKKPYVNEIRSANRDLTAPGC